MTVENLLKMLPSEIKNRIKTPVMLEFEDGEKIELLPTELVLNRYVWNLFLRHVRIPIVKKHSITSYMSNNMFNGGTINKTFSNILYDIVLFEKSNGTLTQDRVSNIHKIMFEINNSIYSELGYDVSESVINIDILDLLTIQLDPELMDDMKKVKNELSVDSIDRAYNTLDRIIRTKKEYSNNSLGKAYISGMVNDRQVKQVLGPRGFVTEIDSSIFKYPISNSFTLGMKDLYSFSTESRSAAKALVQSNIAIKESEYFARELQLTTMFIERLEYVDCGNVDYIEWMVSPPIKTDHVTTYDGDLKHLIGKQYKLRPNDGWITMIGNEVELFNKKILLRSVIHCKLDRKHNVCIGCYGETGHSIPGAANVGHICGTTLSSKVSQAILSTKHLTASATSGNVTLDDITSKVFTVKGNGYSFNNDISKDVDSALLIIPQEFCPGLRDLTSVEIAKNVDPEKISSIEYATVELWKDGEVERLPVTLLNGNRKAVFETRFLEYIARNGVRIDENFNYVIDMSKWKIASNMIWLPEVEFSYFTLLKEIKKLIINNRLISSEKPSELVRKLFTLVNSKLSVNIASLEVIVLAFMVKDLDNKNYDLIKGEADAKLTNMLSAIDGRSLGAGYGFRALVSKVFRPNVFSEDNKVSHPLDVLFKSNDVINKELHLEKYDYT